jgi:hypothetical protein
MEKVRGIFGGQVCIALVSHNGWTILKGVWKDIEKSK